MAKKSPLPTSLLNRYVRFVDFLDYLHFGISDFVEETRQRFGKLLCTLLTIAVIFLAITVLISIIVCIFLAAKQKEEGTSDATTTQTSGTYTTVPPTFATTQSSDKGISTTTVKSATTTGSKITTSSPSIPRNTSTTKITKGSPSSTNISTTKTSTRASTIANTTIRAPTTALKENSTAWSSTSASITTTVMRTTNATKPTTTTKPPAIDDIHCVFVADLLNFDHDQALYDKEYNLTAHTTAIYFNEAERSYSAGLWIYGYKKILPHGEFAEVFDHMNKIWADFVHQAKSDLQVNLNSSECRPSGGNEAAITIVSQTKPKGLANCLIFFSGMDEEQLAKVPDGVRIVPDGYKSVVVVSLRDTNLTRIVDLDKKGYTLLNVPLNFKQEHVEEIMEAIRKGFKIV